MPATYGFANATSLENETVGMKTPTPTNKSSRIARAKSSSSVVKTANANALSDVSNFQSMFGGVAAHYGIPGFGSAGGLGSVSDLTNSNMKKRKRLETKQKLLMDKIKFLREMKDESEKNKRKYEEATSDYHDVSEELMDLLDEDED